MGFLEAGTARRRLRAVEPRHLGTEAAADGPALGRGRFRHPVVLHLFYVLKIPVSHPGGWLVVLTTRGIDGFTAVAQGAEPIVFQKVALHHAVRGHRPGLRLLVRSTTLPATHGIHLYWLRPNTIGCHHGHPGALHPR